MSVSGRPDRGSRTCGYMYSDCAKVWASLGRNRVTATVPSPRVALVVDDDPDLALLCALHLQGVGYQGVEASSGAQAMELARSLVPAVVVLDRMLPDCDGLEVLAALRADDRTSRVPVVMASARA